MRQLNLSVILACLMVLMGSDVIFAFDREVDGIFYNLIEDNDAVVTCGEDTLYADTLVIPASIMVDEVEYKVVGIADSTFKGCTDLMMVVFPESLQFVGDGAFEGCTSLSTVSANFPTISTWLAGISSLQEIILGEDVQTIEAGAFKGCSGLTAINLPDGLTAIADETFDGCVSLDSIAIPASVKTIGDNAFRGCASLKAINLSEDLTSVSLSAFNGCAGLELAAINLAEILPWFAGLTNLKEVALGDLVTAIGDGAFKGCSALTTIYMPEELKTVGENAFNGCSALESIEIPAGATVPVSAFKGCTGLTSVAINTPEVLNWFAGLTQINNVSLADEVTSIADGAFKGCTALEIINLPEELKTIGENAFYGCSSLTSIEIPVNATVPVSAFKGCDALTTAKINTPEVLNWFAGLTNLHEVVLGDDVASIIANAFKGCTGLNSINLTDNITAIADGTFDGCSNLTVITIPETIKTIGDNAFRNCTSLASVALSEELTSISLSAFKGCTGLKSVTINQQEVQAWFASLTGLKDVVLSDEVTSIADGAFKNCTTLTTINLPEDLKTVGENAFYGCSALASIVLPANATIPVSAFKGCTGLSSVSINTPEVLNWFASLTNLSTVALADEVTSIADGAFKNCTALTSINLPEDLKTIGENAFNGCSSLTSIVLPAYATIPVTAFKGCSGLTSATINTPEVLTWFSNLTTLKDVTLGENVTTLAKQAFYNCSGLTNVNLNEGLQEIGSWAFGKCTKLSAISIPNEVTAIGDFAFEGCQSLASIYVNTEVVAPWFAGLMSVKKIELGDNVKEIEAGAFARMTSLQEIQFGSNVERIDKTTIPSGVKIYTHVGGKSLLALWEAGSDNVIETGTTKQIKPTALSFVSSTQSTASFVIDNIYPGYELSCNGNPLGSAQVMLTGLCPESEGECPLDVANEGVVYHITAPYTTQPMNVKVAETLVSPTAFTADGSFDEGDAVIVSESMTANKVLVDGSTGTFGGLDPQRSYTVAYTVTVAYGEDGTQTKEFTDSTFVFTSKIAISTMPAKVVSSGEVIVAAQTNITNDEETVGFEWRRTDAPSSVSSHTGEAILYEGAMEGFLHNLTSSNYWNYRPYYESKSGKKYYGEWSTVEADDYSYFEPTVHTYAKIEVMGTTAEVQGYAMPGSDEVTEQGFMYWENANNVKSYLRAPRRISVPGNAKTVTATGQRMTASLTELDYETNYSYVAYMITSKGQTYYGEVQTFSTGVDTTPVRSINSDDEAPAVIGYYDLQGRKNSRPIKGLNIIQMSDGSTRKVMAK